MTPTFRIGRRLLQAAAIAVALGSGLADVATAQSEQQRPVSQNPTQGTPATQARPPLVPTKPGATTGTIVLDRPIAVPGPVRTATPGSTTAATTTPAAQPTPKPAPGTVTTGTSTGRTVQIINVNPLGASATPGGGVTAGARVGSVAGGQGGVVIDSGGAGRTTVPGAPGTGGVVLAGGNNASVRVPGAPTATDRGNRNPPELEGRKEMPPVVNTRINTPANAKVEAPVNRIDAPANTRTDVPARNIDAGVVDGREPESANSRVVVVTEPQAAVSANPAVGRGSASRMEPGTSRTATALTPSQSRARGDALSVPGRTTDPAAHLGLAQISNAQRGGEEANRQGQLAILRDAIARRAADAAVAAAAAVNGGVRLQADGADRGVQLQTDDTDRSVRLQADEGSAQKYTTEATTSVEDSVEKPVPADSTTAATTTSDEPLASTPARTTAKRATGTAAASRASAPGVIATATTATSTTTAAGGVPTSWLWAAGLGLLGLGFIALTNQRKTKKFDAAAAADAYEKWVAKEGPPPQVPTMLHEDVRRNQLLTMVAEDENAIDESPEAETTATQEPDDAFDEYVRQFDAAAASEEGDAEQTEEEPVAMSDEEYEAYVKHLDETVFDKVEEGDQSTTPDEGAGASTGEPPAKQIDAPAEDVQSPEATAADLEKLGTPEALGLALITLGLEHPRATELLERLEQTMAAAEDEEQRETLKAIQDGTLGVDELDRIANNALTKGQLGLYVAASLAAVEKSGEPLAKKASRLADVVATLQLIRDEQLPDAAQTTEDGESVQQDPMAQVGLIVLQRQAAKLLEGLALRIETLVGPQFQDALDKALEDLARAGAAIGEEATDAELAKRQAAIANVRNLSMLRAGLFASALDGDARNAALQKIRREAEEELNVYEKQIAGRDDFPALDRERALARLNGLRAMRDAVEDLLIDAGGLSGDGVIRGIFLTLNGGSGDAGIRRTLDRAEQAGNIGETRRLQDALDYLEHRRVSVLARTAGADAIRRFKDIKEGEAKYWRTLSGDEAGRIRSSVEMYGAMLIPAALGAIRQALIEQGMEPDEVAQQFLRALAQVTQDDVRAGARQWFEYKSRPWYRRGWIVGNYRLWNSHDIEREILEDVRDAEALRLAGENPIEVLQVQHRGAYQRLEKKGFIRNGRYVIPDDFVYSSQNAGSTYGAGHWLDGLNAVTFGEILVTVIIPAGAAARVARGIKAGVDAARATRLGVSGVRLIVEAGAFTAFNRGAQRMLHAPDPHARPIAKDFASNLAIIGGLRVFSKLFQVPERALLGRTAARQMGTAGQGMNRAQIDSAISRLLGRAARKPISQLTRTEIGALGTKAGLETMKAGTEAAAFTAFNTLPVVGHDGRLDWQSFRDNLLFITQMRALHVTGMYGADRVKEGMARLKPDTTAKQSGQARQTPEIAETSEPASAPAPKAQFRNWYRRVTGRVPLADPAALAKFLHREFARIAEDPTVLAEKGEAARSMALAMESGRVNIEFKNGQQGKRGNYDPVTKTAFIHVDEIVVNLYNRIAQTRGRQPKVGEVVQSLLGTTVHEALEHGLQGLDLPVTAEGVKIPDANAPRPYSKLHEARAYWTQRLFDPTLGGKNLNYRRGTAVTLKDVVDVVARNYGDVQSQNRKTLGTLYPDRVNRWEAVQARIQARLDAKLREIHRRGLIGNERQAAIDQAVAKARAARTAAMSVIFRTEKMPPISGKAARLQQVRREQQQGQRESRLTRTRAGGEPRLPAWAERALRRVIGELGIEWNRGEPFGPDQQAALQKLLVTRFQEIAADTTLSTQLRDTASDVAYLIGETTHGVRTQFVDNQAGPAVGAYFSWSRIAEVYLRSIAHVTERMTQLNDGRMSTGEDFLKVLMGATAHEVLDHGFRQQLGIRSERGIPVLGTRPSTRLQELAAFVTQRRFDTRLGGVLDGVPAQLTKPRLIRHVDQQYARRVIELDNEQLLFRIDRINGQNWLNFRNLLDRYFDGRQSGPDARATLLEALEKLPISAEQRRQLDRLLTERDAQASPDVEEFDPGAGSSETRTQEGQFAAKRPALTVEMLKSAMLSELIFTRTLRPGSTDARDVRPALNRLRSRAGKPALLPPRHLVPSGLRGDAGPAANLSGRPTKLRKPDREKLDRMTPEQRFDAEDNLRSDIRENETATILAENGYKVEQNPSTAGTSVTGKPDYKIEGEFADNFAPTSRPRPQQPPARTPLDKAKNVVDVLDRKVPKQAKRLVLNLHDLEGVTLDDLREAIRLRLSTPDNNIQDVIEILVIQGRAAIRFYPW